MNITINKKILSHPDFSHDLSQTFCNDLNSLIDQELKKDDINIDFIDECANAINSIRNNTI